MSLYNQREFLPRELLVSVGDGLSPGSTRNLNHDDCPAGEDRKQRLYVTLKEDGTILGYCHHCGMRGAVRNTGTTSIHHDVNELVTSFEEIDPRTVMSTAYKVHTGLRDPRLPMKSLAEYLNKYSVNLELAIKDGWYYGSDKVYYALGFPIYSVDRRLTGFQVRRIRAEHDNTSEEPKPKVVSYGKVYPHIFNPNDSSTCVICEDRISGLRIAEAGYAACVLHGSYVLKGSDAHTLACMFDNIIVWLDNDNDTVIANANATYRILKLFTSNTYINGTESDPKNYDVTQVSGRIKLFEEEIRKYA